ncbi:MAG: tRNA (adenosine(37)-N6)-dimethylallyltransferase MiaA [Lacibacter sp.]
MKKTVLILAGPTASGKTLVAAELARRFETEIISADSRQCYKELKIGVAAPPDALLDEIPHHFIQSHSIFDNVTAVTFEEFALKKVEELFLKKDLVVITGGTGLYIQAFCEGLDNIPAVPDSLRQELIASYEELGFEWLEHTLIQADPLYASQGEMKNPQRMLRALEVIRSSGHSILSYRTFQKKERDFRVIKMALELPRTLLYERINHRVDEMIQSGLIDEAKSLISFKQLNALQTVGYKELFAYFDGSLDKKRAIELIKQHTRHYAKRQLTWFRRDSEINWFHPDDISAMRIFLEQSLNTAE